jgi:hypothetical protein
MVVAKVDEDDGTNFLMENTTMIVHLEAPLDGVVKAIQPMAIVTPPLHKTLDVVTSPPPRHGGAQRRRTTRLMFKPYLESVKPSLEACHNQSGNPQELASTFSMHPQVVNLSCQTT